MSIDAVARLERELGVLLRRSRALSRATAHAVHPDLNFEAYSILVRLDDTGRARPSELARYFRIGKPTLSRQVQLLEQLQLVERTPDPVDARAVLLTLSETGRAKVHAARQARRDELIERVGPWGEDTLRRFAALTERLNASLDADGGTDAVSGPERDEAAVAERFFKG
ncbi:MarR family winged helix-turn-helix transcriptional regulator [Kineococcus sp. SYSU DK005]|uniref:MarR family winged helix-turn-helix transcriptional regulator n=1 Tax=Kineococcus sp. SYSU DK005 TaxID=3383126 RepID=UPI003D7ED3D0